MALPPSPPITDRATAEKQKAANALRTMDAFKAGSKAMPKDVADIQQAGQAVAQQQAQADIAATGAEATDTVKQAEQGLKQQKLEQQEQNIKTGEQLNQKLEDQKSELIQLDIGINETDFDNKQMIAELEQGQNFSNEQQLLDFMALTAKSDEDFKDKSQAMQQSLEEQVKADEWELQVFTAALDSEYFKDKLAKDKALNDRLIAAKAEAERKAKESRKKAGMFSKMVGAVKLATAVAVTFATAGAAAPAMAPLGIDGLVQAST